MSEDYAIIYNGKLKDIKSHLKNLEKININIANLKKAIESIEIEVESNIKLNYEMLDEVEQSEQLNNLNAMVYNSAIERLNKFDNQILNEYNNYYKINILYKNLNKKVENANEDNIAEIVTDCLKMLTKIKSSSNIDYSMEKELVENIYELVYKVIKLELIYSDSAGVLFHIRNNSTDSHYIIEHMKREIESLDDNKHEVKMLKEKIEILEENGLDNMFLLDKDVMILLAISTNENLNTKTKKQFLDSLENHQILVGDYERKENEINTISNEIDSLKRKLKISSLKIFKKKSFLTLNLLLISASITGSTVAIGNLTKEKEYKTYTTVYDSSTDKTTTSEDYENMLQKTSINITEYSPWDVAGYFRDEYSRNVYKYNLDNVEEEFLDLKDYLTSDIKENISFEREIETQKEKPEDLDYSENKYIITRKRKDENDFQRVYSYFLWELLSLVASAVIINIDIKLLKKISPEKLRLLRKNKKRTQKMIKDKKTLLLEEKNNFDLLSQQLLLSKLEVLDNYEKLPVPVQENPELKEKIMILRNSRNNS